jgi:thioredoxin 1
MDSLPNSVDEFLSLSASHYVNKLFVFDFKAHWCAPCKVMLPFVDYLKREYPDVSFYLIDIEDPDFEEYPAKFAVTKVPTFILIKNGEVVSRMVGPDKQKLEELVGEHSF